MGRISFTVLLVVMFMTGSTHASGYIGGYIPDPAPVGTGRLTVFLFDVYDATLFAPDGIWEAGKPLALKLTYLRNIKGSRIADTSAEEMRNIGISDEIRLAAWHTQMRQIFPDVQKGMSLTGILSPEGETIFLKDGEEIGRIRDPDFGHAFFGIWLSEKTSAPDLRQKLLGTS